LREIGCGSRLSDTLIHFEEKKRPGYRIETSIIGCYRGNPNALSQRVALIYESTWERFSSLAYRREMDFPRKIFIAINFHGSAAGVAVCMSGSNRAEGLKDLRRLGEPHRP